MMNKMAYMGLMKRAWGVSQEYEKSKAAMQNYYNASSAAMQNDFNAQMDKMKRGATGATVGSILGFGAGAAGGAYGGYKLGEYIDKNSKAWKALMAVGGGLLGGWVGSGIGASIGVSASI